MYIKIGFDIVFDLPAATPFITMLDVHPTRVSSLMTPDDIQIFPNVLSTRYLDSFGNVCRRFVAQAGQLRLTQTAIVSDTGELDARDLSALKLPVDQLPFEVLMFLLGSRYCEVDILKDFAWGLFWNIEQGWPQVLAVCDWVYANVRFDYNFAKNTRTAKQTLEERVGVCRDFMHLAITLCRCLNIPARYATGYLGDIGVPVSPAAMDFSAWFEVFLGGKWWTVDARHNQRRIGRVLMATGRDATDVAMTTAFGVANLVQFKIVTDEVDSVCIAV